MPTGMPASASVFIARNRASGTGVYGSNGFDFSFVRNGSEK